MLKPHAKTSSEQHIFNTPVMCSLWVGYSVLVKHDSSVNKPSDVRVYV
jgi:hypothetical protein